VGEPTLVFASDRDTARDVHEVYTAATNGTEVRRLTTSAEDDVAPSWSPDGSKIAFVRFSTDRRNSRIMVMNSDGSDVTDVSTPGQVCPPEFSPCGGTWFDGDPSWSPDGRHILFWRQYRSANIYVMNADGSDQRQLTSGPNGETSPDWSPDGKRVVFSSHRDNERLEIFTMDPDGTNVTRLTNTQGIYERDPAWSPDGRHIVFISDRDSRSDIYDVYVMDVDGSNVRRVTTHPADDSNPAWSPDGSRLFFESNRDGNYELYSVNVDGSGVTRLTTNLAFDGWAELGVEGAEPSESPYPDPSHPSKPLYETTITLRLRGELEAVGVVRVEERFAACESARAVEIERRRRSGWATVASTATNGSGRYSVDLTARAGAYRAVALKIDNPEYACFGAYSQRRSYRK
jgi:TolB protein